MQSPTLRVEIDQLIQRAGYLMVARERLMRVGQGGWEVARGGKYGAEPQCAGMHEGSEPLPKVTVTQHEGLILPISDSTHTIVM